MIEFVILRHGESIGNKNRVIQGQTGLYSITPEGIRKIRIMSLQNADYFKNVNCAFTSDLDRAVETLHYIVDELNLTITEQSMIMLREVDPGVLGDVSHEIAEQLFPEYYRIWEKHGDLDGIPGAETGAHLQARALAFIHYVTECYDETKVLVVTHAAFMRSLINTLLFRDRTTSICVENGHIHLVTNHTFLAHRELVSKGWRKIVYRYQGFEQQYAIKTIISPTPDVMKIYSYFVAHPSHSVCEVYYDHIVDGMLYVVTRWVIGNTIHGKINNNEILEAWRNITEIHENLKEDNFMVQTTLYDKIIAYQQTDNQSIKKIGDLLLDVYTIITDENVPVLYDVHRDNFIWANRRWILVDVEGIIMAPEEFVIACFMAVFLLLEDPTIDMIDYCLLLDNKEWDKNKIIILIGYRLYIGLAYAYNNDDLILKEKYKEAFCSWLDLANNSKAIDYEHIKLMRDLLLKVM